MRQLILKGTTMQLYESIRHEHHAYTDDDGNSIPTIWYFVRLEGEAEERRVMTVINPPAEIEA